MEVIKVILFLLLLLSASISDIENREVDDKISVMIAITALIGTTVNQFPNMILSAVAITLPQLIVAFLKPNSYGGADIKIMAACAFYLGFERGLIAIVIGLTLAVLLTTTSRKIRKKDMKQAFPVIPYLAVGNCLAFLI
ncbi:prepilin peptidase [Paludicola sp. MB14-C6]|uniref:prepilin peptidase n=1 Tax=Paludihabitans sp. MB14-C6 TaxID=3070656 RepID=UPI0027DDEAE7|nr:prepilin peptidase [Paludicola sp. MB14-C6]WMJ22870.1 prepilin peptidase [Paludicola sp. MB14-C6]